MDARSINAAHASMSRKPLLERLREHNSLTEVEAANEIEHLQYMLVDAKNERDLWRERALGHEPELLASMKELLSFCDTKSDGETDWERAVDRARRLVIIITPTGFGTQG